LVVEGTGILRDVEAPGMTHVYPVAFGSAGTVTVVEVPPQRSVCCPEVGEPGFAGGITPMVKGPLLFSLPTTRVGSSKTLIL
jgi:hypothetical protein